MNPERLQRVLIRARRLVDVSLVTLALGAGLSLVEEVAGLLGSGLAALAAAGLTIACNRMASRAVDTNVLFHLWRLLPGVLFVALPFVIEWFSGDELSVMGIVFLYAKPILIFVLPLILLTIADRQLRAALAELTAGEPGDAGSQIAKAGDSAASTAPSTAALPVGEAGVESSAVQK